MDKKDIEGALNELLGLNVRWSKLSAKDLEELLAFFGDDKRVFDTLGREIIKERVSTRVDNLINRVKVYREEKGGMLKEILGR